MKKNLLETIKSRGYWRVNFQPVIIATKISSLGDCLDIVEKNRVELRGWDYPHFPRRRDADSNVEAGNNYYAGWIEWYNHIEFWRMYQSGQYLHYFALREDGGDTDGWDITPNSNTEPNKFLSIVGTIYSITEIFEFASRLATQNLYDEGVKISITLDNAENRILRMEDPMRGPLFDEYKTALKEITFSQVYSKEDLITKPQDLALEVIVYIFDRFKWHRPPIEVFKKDQDTLINRRW